MTGIFTGTGSGKTLIALMLARGNTLVICPKTQKEDGNWERVLKDWIEEKDGQNVTIRGGSLKIKNSHISLTVISKETFRRDHAKLPRFDTVISDESHTQLGVIPNVRQRKRVLIPKASQIFEALDEYLERTKPTRLYLCTATIVKSPFTVWAAGKLLKNPVMRYDMQGFYDFRYEFYTKLPMPGREVWVPKTTDATKNRLAEIVRTLGYVGRLEDFFDVPDQTFKTEYVALTKKQEDRIKELRLEYPQPIVRIGKRHQVENGVLTGNEFESGETFENAKIEKILDYAIEFPRMVIFAKYRAQIDQIEAALHRAGKKVLTLTGDTKDRGAVILEANKAEECVFIAQAQISAGWELPEYPVMIFASRTYSFVDYDQALGRIQRANNIKKNLYISLVVRGGVDEAVDKAFVNKCDFAERLYTDSFPVLPDGKTR